MNRRSFLIGLSAAGVATAALPATARAVMAWCERHPRKMGLGDWISRTDINTPNKTAIIDEEAFNNAIEYMLKTFNPTNASMRLIVSDDTGDAFAEAGVLPPNWRDYAAPMEP